MGERPCISAHDQTLQEGETHKKMLLQGDGTQETSTARSQGGQERFSQGPRGTVLSVLHLRAPGRPWSDGRNEEEGFALEGHSGEGGRENRLHEKNLF